MKWNQYLACWINLVQTDICTYSLADICRRLIRNTEVFKRRISANADFASVILKHFMRNIYDFQVIWKLESFSFQFGQTVIVFTSLQTTEVNRLDPHFGILLRIFWIDSAGTHIKMESRYCYERNKWFENTIKYENIPI